MIKPNPNKNLKKISFVESSKSSQQELKKSTYNRVEILYTNQQRNLKTRQDNEKPYKLNINYAKEFLRK